MFLYELSLLFDAERWSNFMQSWTKLFTMICTRFYLLKFCHFVRWLLPVPVILTCGFDCCRCDVHSILLF